MAYDSVKAALGLASRSPWGVSTPYKSSGYTVFQVRSRKPIGKAKSGFLYHVPKTILCAWKNGKLVLSKATWHCGGTSHKFILLDDSPAVFPRCDVCLFFANRNRKKVTEP